MDAATVARVMSLIPDRTPRLAVGPHFQPHTEQTTCLARFLNWLSPLSPITKDDQRALGLRQAHQKPVVELDEEPDLDESELEPELARPPVAAEAAKAEETLSASPGEDRL